MRLVRLERIASQGLPVSCWVTWPGALSGDNGQGDGLGRGQSAVWTMIGHIGHHTRPRIPGELPGRARAPIRSSGFRMPRRERAVELAGGGTHRRPGVGAVRPGAHGALTDGAGRPGATSGPRSTSSVPVPPGREKTQELMRSHER